MSGAYELYDEICNDYCMCSDDESDEPVVSDCVNDEAYDWSGKGYVWNEEAFNSAARIYRIMTGETPDYLPRYNFTFNDYHYYFHDYDYKVKHSGKSVIALCKESPRDKFYYTHLGHKLYWIYNSHDGAEDYVLYKLKQYGEHKLDDIFWCKKFGFLRRIEKSSSPLSYSRSLE